MADTPIRKFMFDKSFDGMNTGRAPGAPVPVTLKPEQLEALKKEAFDAGVQAGKKAGHDVQTQTVNALLARVEGRLEEVMQNLGNIEKDRDASLRNAVLAIAKKLLPDFVAKNGLQEIQALLNDAIAEMVHEPRLVVRIHESEFDTINNRIQEITTQKAYAGKVVVLADAEIAPGDCRIEWADGGVERKAAATMQSIEEAVAPAAPQSTEGLTEETNHG
ncbi:MAG TPA: FliH/SctL family protein [Alphaproteobacteria bacterium]|nr:FliH/SctL family protein [Alphaproteobacteria bacterium]